MAGPGDRAEDHTWGLAVPFVVCTSQGGPYDDESFAAGFSAGRIDAQLQQARLAGADSVTVMARTTLLPQLELLGMHRGYPVLVHTPVNGMSKYPPMPDWSTVTFHAPQRDPGPDG